MTERNIQVKTPAGWRIVGKVVDINGVPSFYREVSRSKHLLRTFSAWGMQASLLPVLLFVSEKYFTLVPGMKRVSKRPKQVELVA